MIGASDMPAPNWIESEQPFLDLLREADWDHYFAPATIDALLAEHVWEHLDRADGLRAAQQCYRYLQAGGYLRIAVPDGNHPDPGYRDLVRVGGSGFGADDHKVLYDAEKLSALLREAGFEVRLLEHHDEEGLFHAVDWDPDDGMVTRSRRFDPRNSEGLVYTSLIVDAVKPR